MLVSANRSDAPRHSQSVWCHTLRARQHITEKRIDALLQSQQIDERFTGVRATHSTAQHIYLSAHCSLHVRIAYLGSVLNSVSKTFYLPIFYGIVAALWQARSRHFRVYKNKIHCLLRTVSFFVFTVTFACFACPCLLTFVGILLMVLVFGLFNGVLLYYLLFH